MSIEIPQERLQTQLAKTLQVSEEFYNLLIGKAEIILDRRFSFPAGSPAQVLLDYTITSKYADFPIVIYVVVRCNNADAKFTIYRVSVGATLDESPVFVLNNSATVFKTILRQGDRILFEVVNISPMNAASGSILIAITKALPVI